MKNAFHGLISRLNKEETSSDFEDTSLETSQSEMHREEMILKRISKNYEIVGCLQMV